MELESLFTSMNLSTSGLTAQRKRLDVVAKNLANIETTRTARGGPYRRQVVTFQEKAAQRSSLQRDQLQGVSAQIVEAKGPFREVYDPSHPDTDNEGIVRYPNVDIVTEMTELISATRAFEANVTAFNASKQLMRKALDL